MWGQGTGGIFFLSGNSFLRYADARSEIKEVGMIPDGLKNKFLGMMAGKTHVVAVAMATDPNVLASLRQAYDVAGVGAILCGPYAQIKQVAHDNNIDISPFEIINADSDLDAARCAVQVVRDGRANVLMKGQIHTADILRAVLNRETGIRENNILSHVAVMYSPSRNRTLFLTDIAMVMYPNLETKVHLINNAVKLAQHTGVTTPKVAPLCAVEVLNPAMQATVDADALHNMNLRGEIKDCIVSGPLALDIAVSKDAARAKGVVAPIAGDADVLLFHNIEAGNNTLKSMVQFGDWIFGGVVLGARVPVVINSRSDSDVSKLFSVLCACAM
ncbi:MAG: phosphate butyryltransferase [Alphaproteobacteria bacterium]|nr:phosphate butyryltransferase [Alphaproteobacteria bacterium]